MRFGRVLTYKDVAEAEKLIGKKVIHSDSFKYLETRPDKWIRPTILTGIDKGDSCYYPFRLLDGTVVQFIREVIDDETDKPLYEPYDLSDKKVRDSLRGRWYKVEDPDGTREEMVTRFLSSTFTKKWEINGWTVEGFLKYCNWIDDGTPCGRLTDTEVR